MGASPASSSASPVTWHVILWVLFSLAINSMAQPAGAVCGISARYRIYLRSSPIICFADALSMLVILVTSSVYLRISPKKATHLLLLARFSEDHNWQEVGDEQIQGVQELKNSIWPRWLFFVLGALPAAIKLNSFTGVPWTQAWGMMFGSSFAIIELIVLLSLSLTNPQDHFPIPEAFGYTLIEWQDSQHNDFRLKIKRLAASITILQSLLFALGFATQAAVGFWAFGILWLDCSSTIKASNTAQDISKHCTTVVFFIFINAFGIYFIAYVFGVWKSLSHKLPLNSIRPAVFEVFFLLIFFNTQNLESDIPGEGLNAQMGSLFVFGHLCYPGYYLISYVSRQFPGIGRALLVDKPPAPLPSPSLPLTESRVSVEDQHGLVDKAAWVAFNFFCCNLIICVLWYAFKYDQRDTVNPAWTDVFG